MMICFDGNIYISVKTQIYMANITVAIPDKLHKKIRKHSEIRWSEIIIKIIEKTIERLENKDNILEKEATEEYVKKAIDISKKHFSKYGYKKMRLKELDEIFRT